MNHIQDMSTAYRLVLDFRYGNCNRYTVSSWSAIDRLGATYAHVFDTYTSISQQTGERKIGDFASPQAFHPLKVQGFNRNRIKLLTQFGGKLPLKVFTLIGDFPIVLLYLWVRQKLDFQE